jgi:DNA-binding transcriptional MerR regulator
MEEIMKIYTVSRLAKLAGVSVRTLHHYDEIGLLKPSFRSESGYRKYQREDLLRLQQILFYRELDFSLTEIKDMLDDPDYDEVQALINHRKSIEQRIERLSSLLNTIDKTINHYKEETMVLTDEELYEGFSKEQIERYNKEVDEKYDPELVKTSRERMSRMSRREWHETKDEGEKISKDLAEFMGNASPDSKEVQAVIKRHHTWIEKFYPANAETYKGLGRTYVENHEFREYYDKFRPGLAAFICAAMEYFADIQLK